ncbi:ABC-three component system middle component 1 [Pseudocolwellia sp. HL-MZ7]|uniref:ABC-three component system middle component 1 n=1 Tax=Pseudocolwellia sp. HL-MZ7 TaxID=3400627 RepID=UPI003CE996FA
MKLLTKESDLEFLSSEYENIQFHMLGSDDSFSFISCIICVCETAQEIIENWRAIQNMVAVYHQHSGGFNAWNIYLAFVSADSVAVWEKYEIENNKFSARKIVLDGLQENLDIDQLIIELERQLFGSDLKLETHPSPGEDNSTDLDKYYSGAPLDSKTVSKEKRALMIDKIIENLNSYEN